MDRPYFGRRAFALLLLLALPLVATAGCASLFATWAYIAHQDTEKPDCDKLEGKRVVVVCRPVTELQFANSNAAPELATLVGELLKEHGKKIVIVSPSEVGRWTDENNWRDYPEIGKAMKADMVVGIDLEQFSLLQGSTLLQGRSRVNLAVYDMKDGGKRIWEKQLPQLVFPPNTPIPASDRSEADFQRQYLTEIAGHISRLFCAHDPDNDTTADTKVLDNN